MRSLYAGSSLGIKDLVPADRRDLNDHVLKSIANLEAQLQAVTPDLATVAEKAMPSGDAAFKSAVALTHLLNADLISALGVTPTFSDNDGD
jgi:predicted lipoprotein